MFKVASLKQPKTKYFPKNRWFDDECKAAKQLVNDAKKVFLQCLNMQNRVEYFSKKRKYRSLIKSKKIEAQNKLHATLLMMRQKSPKEFWNLINKERRQLSGEDRICNWRPFRAHQKVAYGVIRKSTISTVKVAVFHKTILLGDFSFLRI